MIRTKNGEKTVEECDPVEERRFSAAITALSLKRASAPVLAFQLAVISHSMMSHKRTRAQL